MEKSVYDTAILVSELSISYGKIRALDRVSLTVDRGELYGLIGPDGAGKSTLYSILTTLLPPDSGHASICGKEISAGARQIRDIVGYMPQRFSLYPDLSVEENLNFFASIFNIGVKENYDLIAPIYSQLARFSKRRAGALSGGMKQKLALCCALIHRPEVLLLDEPTTGVDAVSRSEFWEILKSIRSGGMTILVSTSYMDEAQLCDRISLIHNGKIMETGTVGELVKRNRENLYNVKADNMFLLLERLREYPDILECYTFGATLHAEVTSGFNASKVAADLERDGLKDVEIFPAETDIEDIFIKLMRHGKRQCH